MPRKNPMWWRHGEWHLDSGNTTSNCHSHLCAAPCGAEGGAGVLLLSPQCLSSISRQELLSGHSNIKALMWLIQDTWLSNDVFESHSSLPSPGRHDDTCLIRRHFQETMPVPPPESFLGLRRTRDTVTKILPLYSTWLLPLPLGTNPWLLVILTASQNVGTQIALQWNNIWSSFPMLGSTSWDSSKCRLEIWKPNHICPKHLSNFLFFTLFPKQYNYLCLLHMYYKPSGDHWMCMERCPGIVCKCYVTSYTVLEYSGSLVFMGWCLNPLSDTKRWL